VNVFSDKYCQQGILGIGHQTYIDVLNDINTSDFSREERELEIGNGNDAGLIEWTNDQAINNQNKEKKHSAEAQGKSVEDLDTATGKVDHLLYIKDKLEETKDELEGGLDEEINSETDLEKTKRKLEGDLKISQDTIADIEGDKRQLEGQITAKKANILHLAGKLDGEQGIVKKAQKATKKIKVGRYNCATQAKPKSKIKKKAS